ncbi:MAG: MGMT family protein [Halobacteriaceae archaeon]
MDGIFARESSYLGTWVQVGMAGQQVMSVSFPATPEADAETELELLDRIFAYLEGVHDDFTDVDIALTVPTDHRAVLEATRQIPYGEQTTVEDLVKLAGLDPKDEAVIDEARAALAENPTPLLVPDHRVRDGPSAMEPAVEQRLRSLEGL